MQRQSKGRRKCVPKDEKAKEMVKRGNAERLREEDDERPGKSHVGSQLIIFVTWDFKHYTADGAVHSHPCSKHRFFRPSRSLSARHPLHSSPPAPFLRPSRFLLPPSRSFLSPHPLPFCSPPPPFLFPTRSFPCPTRSFSFLHPLLSFLYPLFFPPLLCLYRLNPRVQDLGVQRCVSICS
jgi:hypothetical protein